MEVKKINMPDGLRVVKLRENTFHKLRILKAELDCKSYSSAIEWLLKKQ